MPFDIIDSYARAQEAVGARNNNYLQRLKMRQAQLEMAQLERQNKTQNALREAAMNAYRPQSNTTNTGALDLGGVSLPGRDVTVQGPAQFDRNAFLQSAAQADPLAAMDMQSKFASQDMEQQKQMAALQEQLGKATKAQLDLVRERMNVAGNMIGAVLQAPPEARPMVYQQTLSEAVRMGVVQPGQMPEQYSPEIEPLLMQAAQQTRTVQQMADSAEKAAQQKESQRHNLTSEQLTKRGQDITMRGQNMTDARARDLNEIKRDEKVTQAKNAELTRLTGFEDDMDRLATAANEVLNHPGLGGATGLAKTSFIPGTKGADALAKLNTLKSQVAFGTLQKMRNESKTGGALGNVSDAEGKRLEANLAALETDQSADQVKESLRKIISFATNAKTRARQAVERQYGSGSTPASQSEQPTMVVGPDGQQIPAVVRNGVWVNQNTGQPLQ